MSQEAQNTQGGDEQKEGQGDNDIFAVLKQKGLTQVQNEKLKRCRDFAEGRERDKVEASKTYKENSPKEELVLEHFQLHYNDGRDLFLYPENECGLLKFICTTIRPTKLGYLELYEWQSASSYLAQFMQYEQLDPPDQFPKIIPSPTNVARWQKGDCFDLSILLCSLLIGVGYDAYCVYGKAPRELTTKNEAQMECIFIDKGRLKGEDEDVHLEKKDDNEFTIIKKQKVVSKWDTKVEEDKKQKEDEQKKKVFTIDDDEPDELGPDTYIGRRIHSWVLLKAGKRQVEKSIFIEPSTGRWYYLDQSPYEAVDCVFNNFNFWINMRPELTVKDINFDEMDLSMNWEYVMLDTLNFQTHTAPEEEGNPEDENQNQKQDKKDPEHDQLMDIAQILDMPPPWPPKIFIDKDAFLRGTPLGEGTQFYNKVKVDNYAPYSQHDGLVQKISIYEDYKRLKVKEIRYFFQHRSDKLSIRRRYPFLFKTVEDYEPTKYEEKRKQQWKQVISIDRHLRIIHYYPNRNHDGLIKRVEMIGEKTIEYYENRDDRVIYRSVRFDPKRTNPTTKDITFKDNHINAAVFVIKMTQKYSKNPHQPANEQIAKMIIDTIKQKVTVIYHMNDGEITPIVKIFDRAHMHGFQKIDNGQNKKSEDPQDQNELQKMAQIEKECLQNIKQQETHAAEDDKAMVEPITLEKTLHQKAREKFNENKKKSEEEVSKEQAASDLLYPFLLKRGLQNEKVLTYQQAIEVKNEVMQKLKERLLSRAEIIQKRLEEERHKLEQMDNQLHKKPDLEEQHEEQLYQLNFKIDILEQRAGRFESKALEKYENMDKYLHSDPRLAALHKKQ